MRVLGIETSCDETGVAIVRDGRWIEADLVASQVSAHRGFGGVVPEVAARIHLETLVPLIDEALRRAGVGWADLDAVAVTRGPGLAGCLLVGLNTAKTLAFARGLPLVGVNHLEGHIYANWLVPEGATEEPPEPRFPLLCLIVSGAHSDLVLMRDHGDYLRLGRTRDDAAGEAFDKVARMLGLGYPGGPAIQAAAAHGDPTRYPLPRAWLPGTYDFSFSGLKTAVLRLLDSIGAPVPVADIAASFQDSVVDVLATKTAQAAREHGVAQVALAGGVAANTALRERVRQLVHVPVIVPPPRYCTDNGAMIASAGTYRFRAGERAGLDLDASPVLPLS
jgi:N6-L-threonylcarbamoyladenine synthase